MFKYIVLTIVVVFSLVGCASKRSANTQKPSDWHIDSTAVDDSLVYELVVTDIGYETYLATLPYSKDYYSDSYYRSWNIRYVQEWNMRCMDPIRYGNMYEYAIPYEANIDYGLEFNYRLYHYFLFFEKTYRVKLLPRAR